jgi:cell division septal protein FtsQ
VSIRRKLPCRIEVRVTERVPIAEMKVNDRRVGLDDSFRAFALSAEYKLLPDVSDSLPWERKAACLTFLKSVSDLPIYREICSVSADTPEEITFALRNKGLVMIGSPAGCGFKIAYLQKILADLEAKGRMFEYINMKDFSADYKEAAVMPK